MPLTTAEVYTTTSHLPRLSPVPLAISTGAQDVLARFFAEGFEAAAVTAFGAVGSALPEDRYEVTYARPDFGRPFGSSPCIGPAASPSSLAG